jgi:hypothetical protein
MMFQNCRFMKSGAGKDAGEPLSRLKAGGPFH